MLSLFSSKVSSKFLSFYIKYGKFCVVIYIDTLNVTVVDNVAYKWKGKVKKN